ncbi:hypothetical protein DITRI_Ditri11bG0024200 [Diplodiscus trichospermus]
METKKRSNEMELLAGARWSFYCCLIVDCVGRAGGLALLWKNEMDLEVLNFFRNHIDAVVKGLDGEAPWRFTGYYGEPKVNMRHNSWSLMHRLDGLSDLPWICLGDFNEITSMEEKVEGAVRAERQMFGFR